MNQNPALVQGYPKAVLTPNAMEFSRLVKAVLQREVAPMIMIMRVRVMIIVTRGGNDSNNNNDCNARWHQVGTRILSWWPRWRPSLVMLLSCTR